MGRIVPKMAGIDGSELKLSDSTTFVYVRQLQRSGNLKKIKIRGFTPSHYTLFFRQGPIMHTHVIYIVLQYNINILITYSFNNMLYLSHKYVFTSI